MQYFERASKHVEPFPIQFVFAFELNSSICHCSKQSNFIGNKSTCQRKIKNAKSYVLLHEKKCLRILIKCIS